MTAPVIDRATFAELQANAGAEFVSFKGKAAAVEVHAVIGG